MNDPLGSSTPPSHHGVFCARRAVCGVLAAMLLWLFGAPVAELTAEETVAQEKTVAQESVAPGFEEGYGPSRAFPFGRRNPAAPPELAQFDFIVGVHHCEAQARERDGSWRSSQVAWTGQYILNGHGIQDGGLPNATNIRTFDSNLGKWRVTYFREPDHFSNVWEGAKESDHMVMRDEITTPDGKTYLSRLTFYDISARGFSWKAERVTDRGALTVWKMSCVKHF